MAGASAPHLDPKEWDQLIESVGPSSCLVLIESWMGPHLRSLVQPEDLWQETLCHAWRDRERHDWTDLGAFRGWLLGIARNRVHNEADHHGARKRGGGAAVQPFSVLASGEGSPSSILPPGSTTPSRIAVHAERARAMRAALLALPPDQEQVVRLHLFEELKLEDVAERLGITLPAAKSRFRRGCMRYERELARTLTEARRPRGAT